MSWDARDIGRMGLAQLLPVAAALWSELEVTKRREDRTSTSGARRSSSTTPFVFRLGAAEVMDELAAVLRGIVIAWRAEHREGHRFEGVPALVETLAAHVPWVEKHSRAEEWRLALQAACAEGLRLIDVPPERIFLGRCGSPLEGGVACSVELWPAMGEASAVCPGCGRVWDVGRRTSEALRRVDRWVAPLPRVIELLRGAGVKVTYEQARKWTQRTDPRGRALLSAVGRDASGAKLYRLGDVRSAQRRATRRRTKSGGA